MTFWDTLFKKSNTNKDIPHEVARHLMEQDKKDRELQRDIQQYLIECHKKEELYQRVISLIICLAGVGIIFSGYDVLQVRLELAPGIVLLIAGLFYEFIRERFKKWVEKDSLHLHNKMPEKEILKDQWTNFFKLIPQPDNNNDGKDQVYCLNQIAGWVIHLHSAFVCQIDVLLAVNGHAVGPCGDKERFVREAPVLSDLILVSRSRAVVSHKPEISTVAQVSEHCGIPARNPFLFP